MGNLFSLVVNLFGKWNCMITGWSLAFGCGGNSFWVLMQNPLGEEDVDEV